MASRLQWMVLRQFADQLTSVEMTKLKEDRQKRGDGDDDDEEQLKQQR
jgi:hypothetical protein